MKYQGVIPSGAVNTSGYEKVAIFLPIPISRYISVTVGDRWVHYSSMNFLSMQHLAWLSQRRTQGKRKWGLSRQNGTMISEIIHVQDMATAAMKHQ